MVNARSKWSFRGRHPELENQFIQELKLDPLVARLLTLRGVKTIEQGKQFLFFSEPEMYDPFLFHSMIGVVVRIKQAITDHEKIMVYGDYDADGVSSTALMASIVGSIGGTVSTYIPHRMKEGYGLNKIAIQKAADQGIKLIITVDTGISAVDEIACARSLGIDVIVTDHHEPPALLPDANFIINPKVDDCGYPYRELAGVGVALKVAQALSPKIDETLFQYAAIGTIADMMVLTDENRTIVHRGLLSMRKNPLPGIKALLNVANINYQNVKAHEIGFSVGPRINASGRLDNAKPALDLYMSKDPTQAVLLAYELDQANAERQALVKDIAVQAINQMTDEMKKKRSVIIVKSNEWPMGVVGIVAARLMEMVQRPVIVMRVDEASGEIKGSARAPKGVDLIGLLREVEHFFTHYGGHAVAAGMAVHIEDFDAFESAIEQAARAKYGDALLTWRSELDIDVDIEDFEISVETIEQLELLEPFGIGNPKPLIMWPYEEIKDIRWMGKNKEHIKITTNTVEAIRFQASEWQSSISKEGAITFVGEPSINEYNGKKSVQIMIKDAQVLGPKLSFKALTDSANEKENRLVWNSTLQDWELLNATTSVKSLIIPHLPYTEFQKEKLISTLFLRKSFTTIVVQALDMSTNLQKPEPILPDREQWTFVYRLIRERTHWSNHLETWNYWMVSSGFTYTLIRSMISVFEELNWIKKEQDQLIVLPAFKRNLIESSIYRMLEETVVSSGTSRLRWTEQRVRKLFNECFQLKV